jgi:hypothetical protein
LFFGHKNGRQIELRVDLGDLKNEKEQLTSFLQSHFQVSVTPNGNKVKVKSEKLSAEELRRVVTKFVYHRNFNKTLTGSPSEEQQLKSIGSREQPKKQKNTREARHTKPKCKAGDYDTHALLHARTCFWVGWIKF